MWQQLLTFIATFASICLVAFIVRIVHEWSALFSAFAISIFNGVFPEFAKILVKFEGHATEAGVQTSMYLKICLFRWVNTAVVITIITPFTATLFPDAGGLITQIYALFFTEIFTMNVIQLTDPYGHFLRHVLAPRAKTQDEMNLQMKGLEVELAERYTNMTKIVFLAFWYSSIYPMGFFMASFALFINYFTDRHSLMRTWKRAPPLGPGISEFSRRYFVTASFLAMALLSSYFWASFPMVCTATCGLLSRRSHVFSTQELTTSLPLCLIRTICAKMTCQHRLSTSELTTLLDSVHHMTKLK